MDSGRLPAYRFSYLLRFHPYPRAKPSVRERIEASAREHEQYLELEMLRYEIDTWATANQAAHGTQVHDEIQLHGHRLNMSSLVDFAFQAQKLSNSKAPWCT